MHAKQARHAVVRNVGGSFLEDPYRDTYACRYLSLCIYHFCQHIPLSLYWTCRREYTLSRDFAVNDADFRQTEKDWYSFVEKLTERLTEIDETIPELPYKDVVG